VGRWCLLAGMSRHRISVWCEVKVEHCLLLAKRMDPIRFERTFFVPPFALASSTIGSNPIALASYTHSVLYPNDRCACVVRASSPLTTGPFDGKTRRRRLFK
jgi:hypothetical protein